MDFSILHVFFQMQERRPATEKNEGKMFIRSSCTGIDYIDVVLVL